MNSIRRSYKGGFKPATLTEQVEVPLAIDNIVCAHCGLPLGETEYMVVSSPRRKGIVLFACRPHISNAMNLLGQLIEGLSKVPEDLKLPDEKNN